MARILLRGLASMAVTMFLVSVVLFVLLEAGSGDVTLKLLGAFATPEQRASYRAQLGLDQPLWLRYTTWLLGNDWWLEDRIGLDLIQIRREGGDELEWWAERDGRPVRWQLAAAGLMELRLKPDGTTEAVSADELWRPAADRSRFFWGLDSANLAWAGFRHAPVCYLGYALPDEGTR